MFVASLSCAHALTHPSHSLYIRCFTARLTNDYYTKREEQYGDEDEDLMEGLRPRDKDVRAAPSKVEEDGAAALR